MIAIKNLQWLHEILNQENVLRAVAAHYTPMVSNAQVKTMLEKIINTSRKNSEDVIAYLKTHL
jgi:hypothetical protein